MIKIAATGFVNLDAGSVASANAVILQELLHREIPIDFFTKPSFVDPGAAVAEHPNAQLLSVIDCTNRYSDSIRRRLTAGGNGVWGKFWSAIDSTSYHNTIVRKMRQHVDGDVDLWLGDWARGRGMRSVVSFAQGPPGTDARSVFQHLRTIRRLAGPIFTQKLACYARYRLWFGLPRFHYSDRIIVGSQWSRECLLREYGVALDKTLALPYPIDLKLFKPQGYNRPTRGALKLLWLGRFAPRKRLDMFLDGLAEAIKMGCDVTATIVGRSDFVPNYERLIKEFQFPERICHVPKIPRTSIPKLIFEHDVMCQPSDEENFGSSVAEAMACGIPSIVGATNGTGDYICDRSIRLSDTLPTTLAAAIQAMATRKHSGEFADPMPTRTVAEHHFSVERITEVLLKFISSTRGIGD